MRYRINVDTTQLQSVFLTISATLPCRPQFGKTNLNFSDCETQQHRILFFDLETSLIRSVTSSRQHRCMGRRFDSCPRPIAAQFESLETRHLLAADMVLQWNEVLIDAIRIDKTAPPTAARAMAIVQTAVFDAVNSIDRRPERGQADRFNRQPVAHGRPDRDRSLLGQRFWIIHSARPLEYRRSDGCRVATEFDCTERSLVRVAESCHGRRGHSLPGCKVRIRPLKACHGNPSGRHRWQRFDCCGCRMVASSCDATVPDLHLGPQHVQRRRG